MPGHSSFRETKWSKRHYAFRWRFDHFLAAKLVSLIPSFTSVLAAKLVSLALSFTNVLTLFHSALFLIFSILSINPFHDCFFKLIFYFFLLCLNRLHTDSYYFSNTTILVCNIQYLFHTQMNFIIIRFVFFHLFSKLKLPFQLFSLFFQHFFTNLIPFPCRLVCIITFFIQTQFHFSSL